MAGLPSGSSASLRESMKTVIFIMGFIPLIIFAITGAASAETVTIENFDYGLQPQTVEFTKIPQRVITTNGSSTELMLRLGLEKHIVGTAYLDNPVMPDLQQAYDAIPVIAPLYPNKEVIMNLEPDLLLGWRATFAPNVLGDVPYWHNLGINTFITRNTVLTPPSVENFYADLRDIGRIFQIEERTEAIIAKTQADIAHIQNQIPQKSQQPQVLMAEMATHGNFRGYGSETLAGNMLEIVGGRNVLAEGGPYSLEHLIEADPEVIFIIYMQPNSDNVQERLDELRNNPLLREVKAVRNNRLYGLPLAEVFSAGVRIPDAIKRMATNLYPDVFLNQPL